MASLLAGVVAPAFLPGAGRRWVRQVGSGLVTPARAIVNPDYVNAPFEVAFFWHREVNAFKSVILARDEGKMMRLDRSLGETHDCISEPWPLRFKDVECRQPVPPFMLV